MRKYTSHFIWKGSKGLLKVLLCERWVEGWTELQDIDSHSYGHNSVSFPFSCVAPPGAWGPSLAGTCSSSQHLLSNSNCSIRCWFSLPHLISNCLTSCLHPGYIFVRRTPSSCGRHKSHSIQPVHGRGYILIFLDRMHLLFTQVHFLFWQLGRGQYVTVCRKNIFQTSPSSFVCTQLNGFKNSKWLNSSIWSIDETLTGITTPSLSGHGSIGNEEVLFIY